MAWGWAEKGKFLEDAPQAHRDVFEAQSPQKQLGIIHATAFTSCAMMVEQWMRREAPNEVCLMVVEDNDQFRKLLRETQQYHQDPKLGLVLDEESRRYFPLKKIKEDPLFQGKRASSVLQLADFSAYVMKKFLMNDPKLGARFIEPLWGQFVAPSVPIPKI